MTMDSGLRARARSALHQAAHDHLYDPNVTMIDFGRPHRAGRLCEDELAIRVHVRRKLVGAGLEAAVRGGRTAPIPQIIAGIPTDVTEGRYRPHWVFPPPRSAATIASQWGGWPGWNGARPGAPGNQHVVRADPMRGGMSISDLMHYASGTLGGLVYDRASGDPMLLSNWHVLVENWAARPGLPIVQPGRLDGGAQPDEVAVYARDAMAVNLDAAVAALSDARRLINDQVDLGPVRGLTVADLGMTVVKSGRGSGTTSGRVLGVEGVTRLVYVGVERMIRNCVTIEPVAPGAQVSAGGDSGSLWLEAATHRAIGLHFAGSDLPERALAMDIGAVLDALRVDLATN